MKKQLNDIKSKIYRSRYSEKMKINKINKMKKNIGIYNEKNVIGIKKSIKYKVMMSRLMIWKKKNNKMIIKRILLINFTSLH